MKNENKSPRRRIKGLKSGAVWLAHLRMGLREIKDFKEFSEGLRAIGWSVGTQA